jgi:DNA (cytosine-5)-methyltransferase 1
MGERRPPLVMLENVTGFLTSHEGRDFEAAMLALNEIGYAVDPFILDAKWFVPQSRPRLFIVGARIDAQREDDAQPAMLDVGRMEDSRIRPAIVRRFIQSHPNIDWAIRDLPEPPAAAVQSLEDILERLPDDAPQWWSRQRADYLYGQFSDRHRAVADAMIGRRRWSYATVFRRVRKQADGAKRSMGELRTDGLAGCLRTPKGGSGRQILFKAGYGEYRARLLTPRECARLMGADDFSIAAPDNQAYFGFGDAVCTPAITWIARRYLNPLFEHIVDKTGSFASASPGAAASSPCR